MKIQLLTLYPFRYSLRFSKTVTGMLIGLLTIIQVLLGLWVSFVPGNHAAMISAISTSLYLAASSSMGHLPDNAAQKALRNFIGNTDL